MFFKVLNTAVSLSGEETMLSDKIQSILYPRRISIFKNSEENKIKKSNEIKDYPQYMQNFDYSYMETDAGLK